MIQVFVKHNIKLVAKGRPKVGRWGVYTPAKTRKFETDLKKVFSKLPSLAKSKGGNFGFKLPIQSACAVEITFLFAKPKSAKREHHTIRPDLDNLCKGVFDSANKILWNDDSQITNLVAEKKYSENGVDGFILKIIT